MRRLVDVFLSYNRADTAHAAALNAWLGAQGVATFFDRRDLGGGQLWLPDLERAIEQEAQSIAVLVGPYGLGNTQQYEYQLALTRQARDAGFPLIPVVLPGTETWQLPRGFLGLQTWVSFADVASVAACPDQLQRLLAAIRREPPGADTIRGTICPYKGLDAFAEEDASLFFGRETEAMELHRTILTHRVAAVIGRSGSGKSSLARAGLLPRLRQREPQGWGTVWDRLVIRPGAEPLLRLAEALSLEPAAEDAQERFRRLDRQAAEWRTDQPEMLARFLHHRLEQASLKVNRLLILVDQAEELFALPWHLRDAAAQKRFRDDAAQFIRLLLGAAERGPASVVLTIREDYFGPLMHSPFAPVLKDALVPLRQIEALRPCVERPAAVVGLTFSPGLVDRIVVEVGADESNLPLLQHALQRTWQRREGAVLSANAYHAAGGVAQAINQAAQACFDSLTTEEQGAAKRLFLRLVRPGEGNAHLRVRTPVPDDALEQRVMEAFAAPERRLLFVGMEAGRRSVEVAHEALVRGWPTLLGWVETSRERLRARSDVLHWIDQAGDSAPELLPGGALLQRARDLLRDPGDVPVDDLRDFVQRSVRRGRWRRNRTVFAVVAAFAVLTGLSLTVFGLWRTSEAQRVRAETTAAVAQSAASGLIFNIAQDLQDQLGMSSEAVRKILDTALGVLDRMLAVSHADPALLRLKMAALGTFADIYGRIGDTQQQRDAAQQSVDIARMLANAAPDNMDRQSDLSVSYEKIGDVQEHEGNLADALKWYREEATIQGRLIARDPKNQLRQQMLAVTDAKIGDVLMSQGTMTEALQSYRAGLAIIEPLAKADPSDTDRQRILSACDDKIGDVEVAQGNLAEALKSYRAGLAIVESLSRADASKANVQRDLSVSYFKIGEVLMAQRDFDNSLQSYRSGLEITQRLAKTDLNNADWQRDMSVFYRRIGDVLEEQGKLAEELQSYRDSLTITMRLAKADPRNADWQHDLSAAHSEIGDALQEQGKPAEALQSYQDALAIIELLVKQDPNNAGWRRDLSVAYNKVGDAQKAQGNLAEALQSYRSSLAVMDHLANSDPNNAGWQYDLLISLGRVIDTMIRQNDKAARDAAERALVVARAATARFHDDPRFAQRLTYCEDLVRRAGGTP